MTESYTQEDHTELEQALYAALAREAAPASLITRVMAHIETSIETRIETGIEARPFHTRRAPAVPAFRMLSFPARSLWTNLWSAGAHAAAFALIALVVFAGGKAIVVAPKAPVTAIEVRPYLPLTTPGKQAMGGGGGGGAHELVEASKGHLPRFADRQLVPPQIVRNDNPKIPIEPTVVMPQIKLPDANMPNIGLPQSPQVSLASQGPGSGSGFGVGTRGGIGEGNGSGVGPGEDGDYGGGIMHVGSGVSAPVVIYSVDPEFSDEARRAKYQGICMVALIVDEHGNPTHIRVERSLGMGLDEKAVEAVRQYRFKPATYHGRPVPVDMIVAVNFRIY